LITGQKSTSPNRAAWVAIRAQNTDHSLFRKSQKPNFYDRGKENKYYIQHRGFQINTAFFLMVFKATGSV
jgi:hypothetical protein